ncbi:rab-GTPase-TBC domain-containing protein [Polychytrium aggregatum]|uniref:rab-GTPase-TBC domain-containing protein n=1 Tax=Polychytrium aggregatum TaxID=110093 RepID=UPI0022FDF614|nr:rab-GTPase-TBC domain-containing protein [Polychytrium aggregatum]KAI9193509.1 rab-GTPase-TBC domain-containing protein [Polychytrium aggregatum]
MYGDSLPPSRSQTPAAAPVADSASSSSSSSSSPSPIEPPRRHMPLGSVASEALTSSDSLNSVYNSDDEDLILARLDNLKDSTSYNSLSRKLSVNFAAVKESLLSQQQLLLQDPSSSGLQLQPQLQQPNPDLGPSHPSDPVVLSPLAPSAPSPVYVPNGYFSAFQYRSSQPDKIDWDFWGKVISDYEHIARKQSRLLTKNLQKGIPPAIRGMVWQLLCKGKNEQLEQTFRAMMIRHSTHEKLIQRDLARTFPKHEYFQDAGGPGQESLFNVTKAYSLYDPEVGYCQGISFIVGPLLLNMPDEEAFCCLVQIMNGYGFRELFTPQMTGLQLRLYQFDRLVEEMMPNVFKHLEQEGIKSTMYASQWFMTVFAYRFPLDLVLRILDIVFAEGIESVVRFSLALMKRNKDEIVKLDFENALDFLKNGLFDVYMDNIEQLIQDASAIKLPKWKLDKLKGEWEAEFRKGDQNLSEIDQVKVENRHLKEQLKRMEQMYQQLNLEHTQLANELLEYKLKAEKSGDRVEALESQVEGFKDLLAQDRLSAEAKVKEEMDYLCKKNLALVGYNDKLQDEIQVLEMELIKTRQEYVAVVEERDEMIQKWDGLKRVLG